MGNTAADVALVHRFFSAELFTVFAETAVLFFLMRYVFTKQKHETSWLIFVGILASAVTIPYVWFVFPDMMHWSRYTAIKYSEPFAFAIEVILYRMLLKTDWKTAIALSLICNVASYVGDEILKAHGYWFYGPWFPTGSK